MNKYPATRSYILLHKTEDHARPVIYRKGRHRSFASFNTYPLFLDPDTKLVRIAVDYILVAPKVFVIKSIPFDIQYPISEMYIH
jgi:hypothetical protein